MVPFKINGKSWRVVWVAPDSPFLIDKTHTLRLATTDSLNNVICVSNAVQPPLLDRVLLHEVAHAIDISYGILWRLGGIYNKTTIEEMLAQTVENYGLMALSITSSILGRPICIEGMCFDKS